jgi:hypothetical protein
MPIDTQVYQSAPTQPQPQSNGLWNLAPTIGSVLGGIGGEAADVFGGGIAGSALGGALGQQVENWATGSKGSDVGAGVGGGLGALGGNILGRVAGGLGGGALNTIAKFTAPKVAEDVGAAAAPAVEGSSQAAYDKPFVDALSDTTTSSKLQKQGIQFQPVRDFMQNQMGASNDPQEWSKIANFIAGNPEGEGAYLSKQVTNAAANQPDIPQSEVLNQLHAITQNHGSSMIEPAETDTMGKWLSNELGKAA